MSGYLLCERRRRVCLCVDIAASLRPPKEIWGNIPQDTDSDVVLGHILIGDKRELPWGIWQNKQCQGSHHLFSQCRHYRHRHQSLRLRLTNISMGPLILHSATYSYIFIMPSLTSTGSPLSVEYFIARVVDIEGKVRMHVLFLKV